MTFKLLRTILIPTIVCLGTVGNILSFLTVTNRHADKSSYTVYLASLAVVDTLSLFGIAVDTWLPTAFGINLLETWIGHPYCRLSEFMVVFFTDISAWLIVLLTLERCFCIYFPHKVKIFCRPKNGIVITIGLVLFFLVFNSHFIYGNVLGNKGDGQTLDRFDERNVLGGENQSASSELVTTERRVSNWTDSIPNDTVVSVTVDWVTEEFNGNALVTQSTFVESYGYKTNVSETSCVFVNEAYGYFFKTWVLIDMAMYFILPVLIIIIANTATGMKIYWSARTTTSSIASLALQRSRHVLILTSLVSTAYVVFVAPAVGLQYFSLLSTEGKWFGYTDGYHVAESLQLASECLFLCNHSVNICLYILSGSRFRNDLKSMFCKADRQKN